MAVLAAVSVSASDRPEILDSAAYRAEMDRWSEQEVEKRRQVGGHVFRACDAGIAAFRTSVHSLIRARCVACHDVNATVRQGPPFAVADPAESYSRVERHVKWDDRPNSYLVIKGGNRHCVGYGFDCATGPEDLRAVVEQWWTGGESSCPRLGKYFTQPQKLPANLPTGRDSWVAMRFDLSEIDPSLDGAIFEIEVQHFAQPGDGLPGAYRFRKPRLASVLNPVRLKGIKVLINGKYDAFANGYVPLELTVGAAPIPADPKIPLPHPVLSADPLIVAQDLASGDQISIAFDDLKAVAVVPGCRSLALYQKGVVPTLNARKCTYCHGGNDPNEPPPTDPMMIQARKRLSFAGNDAALCGKLLQRVTPWNHRISPLIAYPLKGIYDHPRIIPSISEVSPGWLDWMAAELAP
jgi:hypothetical protein